MKKLVTALMLLAMLPSGSGANPHASDTIRWEARLFSQIVPINQADMEGVGPGQSGRHQDNCGPFGEAGRGVFDKDISCDDPIAPDNEIAIAVHPTDANLVLAGSNDYQIQFVGNTSILQVPSGFFLSQDGGGTWIDGELPLKGDLGGGDPVPAFDVKHNQMVFASLSFVCGQFAPLCSRGNILFASSPLSNLTGSANDQIVWSDQTVVNGNSSDAAAQQIFLDKEWMAVDNNPSSPHYGNIYITFSAFRIEKGVYDESPIWFVKSEDGGRRWTLPVEISGRNPAYCTFQDDADDTADRNGPNSSQGTAEGPDDPFACDQDQFSIPAVAPNGDLYIQFDNEQNLAAYELPQRYDSQVMFVKSSDGGDTFEGEAPTATNQAGCVRQQNAARGTPRAGFQNPCIVPRHIVNKEDSYDTTTHGAEGTPFPDYPINVSGRTTLTGHQFRVNSAGTIAIGPIPMPGGPSGAGAYRVWTVWDDNCEGVRPGPGQTVEMPGGFSGAVTNINVYYAYSDDGGATWVGGDSGGVSCVSPKVNTGHEDDDQFYPWAAADPVTGALSVGYMDESQATTTPHTPDQYVFSVQTSAGTTPLFSPAVTVASSPSNVNNSLFFRAGTASATCPNCATFIGDYNGVAVGSDGKIHSVWTDMRRNATPPFPNRAVEDAFYASIPAPAP
jgi:hypothetical protein